MHRDLVAAAGDAVLRIDVDQFRLVLGQLKLVIDREGGDDQMSPGAARRAAEPLTEMTPEPRSARIA